jgi:C1A family cysteine protease
VLCLITVCQGDVTYRKNHLSHLSADEFKRFYLSTYLNFDYNVHHIVDNTDIVKTIPESFDWRHKHMVNPVKNQGTCGSCWAFAVVASMENSVAINNGVLLQLSEQQLVDCDTYDNGCNGGSMNGGILYSRKNLICSEAQYPYAAVTGKCHKCHNGTQAGVHIKKSYYYNTVDKMLQGIQKGVLLAHIDATYLQHYHAVAIVGYGIENGVKYWIVCNSWSSNWGEDGYFRIQRGVNKCGIEQYSYGLDAIQLR